MSVTSARNIVNLKEKGHFEHKNENERVQKYTLADELPARLSMLQVRSMGPSPAPSFKVRKVDYEDIECVLDFLRRFFFRDEPLNLAVNLLETPESRCDELEEYAMSSLQDKVSMAAFDDSGKMVGVIINGIARRKDVDYSDKSSGCANPKFARILKVLGHLEREAKIWEKLPHSCNVVLEFRIASTHPDWRGRGLMRILCEEAERLAHSIGAAALRMDTTSKFSAAAAERLGYRCVYKVLYKDLPFAPQPAAPHLDARVYIKEL